MTLTDSCQVEQKNQVTIDSKKILLQDAPEQSGK
jgi:hypothetical protein